MGSRSHSPEGIGVAGAPHGAGGGGRAGGPLLLLSLLAIGLATLTPGGAPADGTGGVSACLLCGERGAADAVLNVLLFVPLGMALGLSPRRRWLILALIPPLLSLAVEAIQLLLPTRQSALGDLVANSAGGWLGLAATRLPGAWLRPAPRRAFRLGVAWVSGAVGILLVTGWLLQPSYPESAWYGQWTAELGHLEAYRGRVLEARIGNRAVPSRRLDDPAGVRALLAAGAPVRVRFVAAPPPPGVAPVFSIFDERRREILLLGADGQDLVLRYRTRALSARFDQPDLRLRGAFRNVAPGDTLELTVHRPVDAGFCARLRMPASARASRCGLRHSVGRGWALLRYPAGIARGPRPLLDFLWGALLALPAGWWLLPPSERGRGARGSRIRGFGARVALVALIPVAALAAALPFSLAAPAWATAGGAAVGALAGAWLRRLGQGA